MGKDRTTKRLYFVVVYRKSFRRSTKEEVDLLSDKVFKGLNAGEA